MVRNRLNVALLALVACLGSGSLIAQDCVGCYITGRSTSSSVTFVYDILDWDPGDGECWVADTKCEELDPCIPTGLGYRLMNNTGNYQTYTQTNGQTSDSIAPWATSGWYYVGNGEQVEIACGAGYTEGTLLGIGLVVLNCLGCYWL